MWPFSRKPRVPESIAVSLVGAASLSLHVGWLSYFVVMRSEFARAFFHLPEPYGLMGGLYLIVFSTFFILFGVGILLFKGRDCSEYRDHIFWFFLASIVTFLLLTAPGVVQFSFTPGA